MAGWKKILLAGDAETEVEAADPLTLAGDVTIVGAGKSLEAINIKVETPTELTIATGDITRTQVYHTVDTEADAASDDLDGIAGGADGMLLLIRPVNDAHTVVVRHNQNAAATKNILLASGANATLDSETDFILLVWDVSVDTNGAWIEVARGTTAVAENAIGNTEIDNAATDIAFNQLILTPKAAGDGTTEGTLFYDSDDDHLYVYQV